MIKPLTSLRFAFAFIVFVSHLSFLEESDSTFLKNLYHNVFYEGYIGVSFFFILSGFIISYNYQDRILNKEVTKSTFYKARFARIYPLHILTFFLALPHKYGVFLENWVTGIIKMITNLTLTQSFIPSEKYYFTFNSPSWSISDEMFFYLVFPLLLLIPALGNKKTIVTLLSIVLLFPTLTLIIPEDYYHHFFYINPLFRLVDFMIGIILYNIYKNIVDKKLFTNRTFSLIEISSIIIFICFFSFHSYIPAVARYSYYYWIPMSLIIFIFAFQKGIISKFLSKKLFIHLGEISFGFYLYHHVLLKYIARFDAKFYHMNEYETIIFAFIITLIISHLSYKYFENPINKYLKKKMIKQ